MAKQRDPGAAPEGPVLNEQRLPVAREQRLPQSGRRLQQRAALVQQGLELGLAKGKALGRCPAFSTRVMVLVLRGRP
jgi:hypothetical protein